MYNIQRESICIAKPTTVNSQTNTKSWSLNNGFYRLHLPLILMTLFYFINMLSVYFKTKLLRHIIRASVYFDFYMSVFSLLYIQTIAVSLYKYIHIQ